MKDLKPKMRNLHATQTLGWSCWVTHLVGLGLAERIFFYFSFPLRSEEVLRVVRKVRISKSEGNSLGNSMQRGPLTRRLCQPLVHRHGQNFPKGPVVLLRSSHFSSGAPSFSATKSWWLHQDPTRVQTIEQVGPARREWRDKEGAAALVVLIWQLCVRSV
jgi:hypothetical protein